MTTHQLSHHQLYHIMDSMISRCYRLKNEAYHNYGGRGIVICNEWLTNFQSFYDWAINNGWKPELTIDRKDNDKNYTPDNCRFVSYKIQARNRRNNKIFTAFNETKTMAEWSEDNRCKVSYRTLKERIYRNWNIIEALITPVIPKQYSRSRHAFLQHEH